MAPTRRDLRHKYGRGTHGGTVWRVIRVVVLVFVVYVLVHSFLLSTYEVQSESMEPTLSLNDRVIATPLLFGPVLPFTSHHLPPLVTPARGSLVVVRAAYYKPTVFDGIIQPIVSFFTLNKVRVGPMNHLPWESAAMTKRVIGIPGDTVKMENFVAYIKPKGQTQFKSELDLTGGKYTITFSPPPKGWQNNLPLSGTMPAITLSDGQYFLLGDNRTSSYDSTLSGPVSISQIDALVLLRYWPLKKIGAP